MTRKMEDIANELGEELEELFAFVKEKFIENVKDLGKPEPEIPDFDIDVKFILKQKPFLKALLDLEPKEGREKYYSPIEWGPKNMPDSDIGAVTLTFKDRPTCILVNCSHVRRMATKLKIDLKENMTMVLIHEMLHTLEMVTGIDIVRSSFFWNDGFTLPIYEAWARGPMVARRN